MDDDISQRLIALESHDLVIELFHRLHHRKLSASRAREIRASARQAREYFRQTETASIAVRPLLAFYGVASLSRALTLLLLATKGESGLDKGHGLETIAWSSSLGPDLYQGIAKIGDLKVRPCRGLFSDLLAATNNRLCIHVRSQAVDWRLDYEVPPTGCEITISDILTRLPDLRTNLVQAGLPVRFAGVGDMSFSHDTGFSATVPSYGETQVVEFYQRIGYSNSSDSRAKILSANASLFEEVKPQLLHRYVQKDFGTIPSLSLIEPFGTGVRFSQISVTYLTSYILGMLARYYPTHWMAMIDGSKGDRLWPTLHGAQHYVEKVFPELVVEFIDDVAVNPLPSTEVS